MLQIRISELRKQCAELQSVRKVAKVYYNNEISYEKLRTICVQFHIPRTGKERFDVVDDEEK